MRYFMTFVAFVSLVACSPAISKMITVSGDVSGAWTADTVCVIGDVTVPQNEGLVIEPGVKVLFQGQYRLTVGWGAYLGAVGTQSDSILFDTYDSGPFWRAIFFDYASNSSEMAYCHITHSSGSGWDGSAIRCLSSSPTIRNSLIDFSPQNADGGCIGCFVDASPNILFNTIVNNVIDSWGGALYFYWGCDAWVEGNIIENNDGHGIYLDGGSPTIVGNSIRQNLGSGIYSWAGGPLVRNNVICDNSSSGYGGGLYCRSFYGSFENNLICNNSAATKGGGVYVLGSSPDFYNNVICDNWSAEGGGFYCNSSAVVTIMNCIIWGNEPDQIVENLQSVAQLIYCDVEGGGFGIGLINADPLFISGPFSDYHLSPTSPCIDAGNPDPGYNDPEDPQNAGFALWPAQGTVRNDMGAYGGGGAEGWLAVEKEPKAGSLPQRLILGQNYPNPFNPITTIPFALPKGSRVTLKIFDVQGRMVVTLLDGWRSAGNHDVSLDASGLASGMYVYRLQADEITASCKLVFLK